MDSVIGHTIPPQGELDENLTIWGSGGKSAIAGAPRRAGSPPPCRVRRRSRRPVPVDKVISARSPAATRDILKRRRCSCDVPEFIERFSGMRRCGIARRLTPSTRIAQPKAYSRSREAPESVPLVVVGGVWTAKFRSSRSFRTATGAPIPFVSDLSMLREPPRPYSNLDREGVSPSIGTRGWHPLLPLCSQISCSVLGS